MLSLTTCAESHNLCWVSQLMLSLTTYAESHTFYCYVKSCYAQCHYAECHYSVVLSDSASFQWKGINRIQITRWQHLSQLKASSFFYLQIFFSCYETQQLILGTGTVIWWVTEPHYLDKWDDEVQQKGADKLKQNIGQLPKASTQKCPAKSLHKN
jgi:hypothetical protein